MSLSSTLKIVDLSELSVKQFNLFGEMVVYFNHRYVRARRRQALRVIPEDYTEPIPLSQIYNFYKCNNREKELVKIAANMFFTHSLRGNNLTKKCSAWNVKKSPHINSGVLKMLTTLFAQNSQHIKSVERYLNTADKTQTVVTTVFQFASQDQAQTFLELINSALSEGTDISLKQPTDKKMSEITIPPEGLDKKQLARWAGYIDKTPSFRNWKCRMKSLGKFKDEYDFVLHGYKL